jgi:hypothetical protein
MAVILRTERKPVIPLGFSTSSEMQPALYADAGGPDSRNQMLITTIVTKTLRRGQIGKVGKGLRRFPRDPCLAAASIAQGL